MLQGALGELLSLSEGPPHLGLKVKVGKKDTSSQKLGQFSLIFTP